MPGTQKLEESSTNETTAASLHHILHIDSHPLFLEGVKSVLEAAIEDLDLVGVTSCHEGLELAWKDNWNLILMDISMPGRGGLDLLKDLQSTRTEVPVLVVSSHEEARYGLRVLKLGAAGYLRKDATPYESVHAVRQVMASKRYISPKLGMELASHLTSNSDAPPHEMLSEREYQVLCFLGDGKMIKEIASTIFLSIKTVSTYRTRILRKLGLENNADIVRYCIRHRISNDDATHEPDENEY